MTSSGQLVPSIDAHAPCPFAPTSLWRLSEAAGARACFACAGHRALDYCRVLLRRDRVASGDP
eukprot:168959-Pyramimonas_sp.AAC.1